jgi:hypothetical protein
MSRGQAARLDAQCAMFLPHKLNAHARHSQGALVSDASNFNRLSILTGFTKW